MRFETIISNRIDQARNSLSASKHKVRWWGRWNTLPSINTAAIADNLVSLDKFSSIYILLTEDAAMMADETSWTNILVPPKSPLGHFSFYTFLFLHPEQFCYVNIQCFEFVSKSFRTLILNRQKFATLTAYY